MNGNIYKFQLNYDEGITVLHTHRIIRPLSVQMQNMVPCLWAEVDEDSEQIEYIVLALGTGHGLNHTMEYVAINYEDAIYCGTVQEGPYVYHIYLYERKEVKD